MLKFLAVKEEKFLKTLALEEKFGGKSYQQQKAEEDKKKFEKTKAAIGFTYKDDSAVVTRQDGIGQKNPEIDNGSDSDSDFDLDTVINFSALSSEQVQDINSIGRSFFLGREDFIKYLEQEHLEQESVKTAKLEKSCLL